MEAFKRIASHKTVHAIRNSKYALVGGLAVVVMTLMLVMTLTSKTYATSDYWQLKAGDKVLATVVAESQADEIIKEVESKYAFKAGKTESVKLDPQIEKVRLSVKEGEKVATTDVQTAVNHILAGEKSAVTYVAKEGDTIWDICVANEISLEQLQEMNPGLDINTLMVGDELTISKMVPYVNVTLTQVVNKKVEISPEVVYEETSDMYEGEEKVKTEGEAGYKIVTVRETNQNGVVTSSETLSEKVQKEAGRTVMLKGTKVRPVATTGSSTGSSRTYYSASSYSGSGSSVASFACQFVGNPYVYGGRSLTNGADCGGFVLAVYNAMGYPIGSTYAGRAVSPSDMQPGDIIHYPGHVSIYIGGGREVHALNERVGIVITNVGYCGTGPIQSVNRVL